MKGVCWPVGSGWGGSSRGRELRQQKRPCRPRSEAWHKLTVCESFTKQILPLSRQDRHEESQIHFYQLYLTYHKQPQSVLQKRSTNANQGFNTNHSAAIY